jgi:NADPH:quinone reductase-like Zn-dependent oxidoreductase
VKAIRYTQYGPPDVLQLVDVEKPTPKDDEVLVKIEAASGNPVDWHLMRGEPFPVRLQEGLLKPKEGRFGTDLAGRVEAVGSHVTQFKPGDEVFGTGPGAVAEYATARQVRLALKPANVSFEAAAAVPVAGITALQGLRDHGQLKAGQKVLINGASGGVGTFAVQIARSLGAEVTGVCSTRNLELVSSLGAAHVIDYTREDYTRAMQQYDLILDNVVNHTVAENRRVLRPGGAYIAAGYGGIYSMIRLLVFGTKSPKPGEQKVMAFMAGINPPDLVTLRDLLASGAVVPVIDQRYPLAQTAEAIRYLETGHARGKVVITVP